MNLHCKSIAHRLDAVDVFDHTSERASVPTLNFDDNLVGIEVLPQFVTDAPMFPDMALITNRVWHIVKKRQ